MTSGVTRLATVFVAIAGGAGVAYLGRPALVDRVAPALPRVQVMGAAEMEATLAVTSARLAADPGDSAAAIRAAEVLLRKARASRSAGPAMQAESILKARLEHEPSDYSALKLLGAVYLSQHKFRAALDVATRGIAVRATDAWNYGVMGDAYLELGDRERAFQAFDRMMALRPDAGAYARVSYALELQGRTSDAIRAMSMAVEATGPEDAEGLAWQHVQLAGLHAKSNDIDAARRAYARALATYPDYPDALDGLARLEAPARAETTQVAAR